MNAEASFAMTISDDVQEKLSAHFDAYSADELAELLRTGKEKRSFAPMPEPAATTADLMRERTRGGRALNTVKSLLKSPKMASAEIADAWGRQLAQEDAEKVAYIGLDDVAGGVIGYNKGKAQAERGERHSFGLPQAGALLLPGGAAYQLGRYAAHSSHQAVAKKGKRKLSTALGSPLGTGSLAPSVPKLKPPGAATMGVAKAGSVGGAPKVVTGSARLREEMDKIAFPGGGMLAGAINKAAPYLAKGVRAVGGATVGQAAGYGAGAGAIAGAGRHLMSGRDPQTGQKRTTLLGSMAGGAALGAGAGLGARAGAQQFQGTGLHKRMTNGAFQFAGKEPVQQGLNFGAGAPGGPMANAAPAPAGPAAAGPGQPGVMDRIKSWFGKRNATPAANPAQMNLGGMP